MAQGSICLVFDDGYLTDKTQGLQAQLDRGMIPKGTSFICGSYVLGSDAKRLHVNDCIDLINNGWELGDHMYQHGIPGGGGAVIDMTPAELRENLNQTNEFFETYLNIPKPKHMACPGARCTQLMCDVISLERESIRVGQSKLVTPLSNKYAIPCCSAGLTDDHGNDLTYKYIDDAVSFGYCAVLLFHELTVDNGMLTRYNSVLDYGLKNGIRFVNFTEMCNLYGLVGQKTIDIYKS